MISLILPVYEMKGRGVEMLNDLLTSIKNQVNPGLYEIIISDNSSNDELKNYCETQPLNYYRNPGDKTSPAANFNNAISHAEGDIIKPMCQDDYFLEPDTLEKLSSIKTWAVCKSSDHNPYHNLSLNRLREGENSYGSPTAVAWRACDLRFDENLIWLTDCELWARLQAHYGVPELIDTTVGIRSWEGQLTWELSHRRVTDLEYVQNKYK